MVKGNWETSTLGEICRRGGGFIQTGPFGSQLHASDYVEDGIPTIMPKNIGENKVIEDEISRVSPEDVERLRKYKVQTGDIVYSRRGDVTLRALIREQQDGWLCGTGSLMIRLGHGIVDPKFVSYFLGTSNAREWIQNHAVGATMPNLNTSIMSAAPIAHPPLKEQQKIAAVLSALDAKIELNQRINGELESMAKTLYDYWFVQFDFPFDFAQGRPNEKGKPYKSAGGKMVWNEELKREISLGWEVGTLGDILSLEYGKPLKEEDRSGSGYPVLGSNGIVGYHKEYLIEGYGIVVGRKGTAGAVVWVEDNFYPIDTAFYVKDKLGTNNLFFHYLLLLRSNIKQGESSSAVPGLNRNFAHSIKVPIPEISIIQNFNKIVEPFFAKIKSCNKESQTLTELRDWLLPMLMNGQVQVQN